MPHRLKLIVAYDGAPFAGWQSQTGGKTVQDHLEAALSTVADEAVRVHGAGRTDAGVHAIGQCAHADVAARRLEPERWVHALNASLPPTIRVLRAAYVSTTFHARFSAKGKTYRYRIWNDRVLPPLELGRAWHVPQPLDADALHAATRQFIGRHDFAAFAANRGKPEENTVRTIEAARLRRAGRSFTLEFSGDGFLYKMVRLMVGAIIRCGLGKMHPAEIAERLAAPTSQHSAKQFVAPAHGLILVRVRY
jgi:tRNA pseudouridine38-40 synthase